MFYYIGKESIMIGNLTVYMQTESRIENYKQIKNFGELVEYEGDNIPSDLEYDSTNDTLYSKKEKPSPFHKKIDGQWQIVDKEGFKKYKEENIDKIKAEVLEYGFDYQGHRQRCRDKDIAYMVANIVSLQTAKVLGKEKKITWYFEDNFGMWSGLEELGLLMLYGTSFVQSVFDTESYFKKLEGEKLISKQEFEEKRKEVHKELVGEV